MSANLTAGAIASLPMYDLPEIRPATDAFWRALSAALRRRGIEAPEALTRDDADFDAGWSAPNLLLSQTCGLPLVTGLERHVVVVATPAYSAPGCDGAYHRAAMIVQVSSSAASLADLKGGRCAVNSLGSNTGMNLLRAEVAAVAEGRRFFAGVTHTGSHVASVEQVAAGMADLAAIDVVTLALLRRHRPHLTRAVRVLGLTGPSPGLPLITSRAWGADTREALRLALADVAADPALRSVRDELLLDGFALLPRTDYGAITRLARSAAEKGYPNLV